MDSKKQIFQTSSKLRWNTVKWVIRLGVFFLLLMIPVVWIAMARADNTPLPALFTANNKKIIGVNPKAFTKEEAKKYPGIAYFLKAKQRNASLIAAEKQKQVTNRVRAGFYVDWDPQSLYSLQSYISDMNMVIPEWFFIDSSTGKLIFQPDLTADTLMRKNNVRIVPMISNVDFTTHSGNFDAQILEKVLLNPVKKQRLLDDIFRNLQQNKFQGINIDFEELTDKTIEPMQEFLKDLYGKLHPGGFLITQNVMPDNEDYDVKELSKYDDYIFLMAYDQHWGSSVPGPISDQKWIEKETDEMAKHIPPAKLVLCLAGFGYDWPEGDEGTAVTYQHALSTARTTNATIDFDNDSYNCSYTYKDVDGINHRVYFMDAGGNFNAIRFADQYGLAGVALWRLGSEDERIWRFYSRDLSNQTLKTEPFNFSTLATLDMMTEKPDYFGDGEVLDVVSEPQKGIIDIENDSTDNLVSEETYQQLPTRYVINRFGEVHLEDSLGHITRQMVVLTFDDGPDPEYTPRILDILEKEKVPGAFFIVGMNAENHLPLLRRIYREGYEIGNHSFTHPNMAEVSTERAQAEMEATRLLIEATTGHSTILFRAPYNADAEPSTLVELKPVGRGKEDHYYTVGESIDPDDWDTKHGVNADSIYNRVVRLYNMYGGYKGIILLHDAGGNREATVKALPRIIQYFKSRNIQFGTVGQLLNLPKDAIMPPVHDQMIKWSGWASNFVYWMGRLLSAAFWVAIILGMARILFMGVMAALEYARSKKEIPLLSDIVPGKVSILVPAFNEEVNAVKTVRNLLRQDYPDFEIIFVDDGSKDRTWSIVSDTFKDVANVKVFTKPNSGKASALNFAIEHASGDYVVCIDADTQLMPDAVRQMMRYFTNEKVAAVAGNVKVGNEKNILTKWQSIEYTTAQNFDRRAFDYLNCITVIPGAIGAFKKSAIIDAGGFTTDTLAEDCDLTIRMLRNGVVIRNCPSAIAVTEAPETLKQFMKQRFRWSYGIMQSFWKNRDACFNPKYKSLGMVALPNILLFQVLMTIFAPLADLLFFFSIAWSWNDPESFNRLVLFYGLFLLVDMAVSVMAFAFEKEKFYKLLWLIPQRFVYRQLMYVVLFRSIRKAIQGEVQGWGALKRTGNAVLAEKQGKP